MNRQEYLNELKFHLRRYPEDFQKDILDSFQTHFEEGIKAGQSEEEIIENLGSVDDVMDNIRMMNGGPIQDQKQQNSDLDKTIRSGMNFIADTLQETFQTVSDIVSENLEMHFADEGPRRYAEGSDSLTTLPAAETIEVVRIDASSLSMDVSVSAGTEVRYLFKPKRSVFSKDEPYLDIRTDGNELILRGVRSSFTSRADLYLEIPESVRSIRIDGSSGDTDLRNVRLDELIGKSLSGDLVIEESGVGNITFQAASGDIKMEHTEASAAYVQCASGDIDIRYCRMDLFAKTISGDVTVRHHDGNEVTLNCVSGDIDADLASAHVLAKTVSGDIELHCFTNVSSLTADTKSGDIDLQIDGDNFTAVCETRTGDIDNDTDYHEERVSRKKKIIGLGSGDVNLATISGDIRVS